MTAVECLALQVRVDKPKLAIVFQKIGRMWPTVNYDHIRDSTNISQLRQVSNALCLHLDELEELAKYSSPQY